VNRGGGDSMTGYSTPIVSEAAERIGVLLCGANTDPWQLFAADRQRIEP
jgi:hypothetical protein